MQKVLKLFGSIKFFSYLCTVKQKQSIMTKKQLERKTRHLISESVKNMRKNITRAINSGAIDITAYADDYELPKIVFGALLKEESFQYEMHTDEGKKAVENLACFI